MDTRWLRDFLTLAEVGSFTQAAQLRHVSQAAFSRRIQSLENWVGANLVDRSRYPLHLTKEGEEFQARADQVIGHLEALKVRREHLDAQRNVRIALPYALAGLWLPAWWRLWSGGDRRWACQTLVGSVLETTAMFASGSADILINYYQPTQRIPLERDTYERAVLFSDKLRPYCSRLLHAAREFSFPGTRQRPVAYFRYSESAYFHRLLEDILESARGEFHGRVVGESEMSEALGGFVAQGLGVAWLPESLLARHTQSGLVCLDGSGRWSADVSIVAFVARKSISGYVGELWRRIEASHQQSSA